MNTLITRYETERSDKTTKQSISGWKPFMENIQNATDINENEPKADRDLRVARLEAEPEEWFRYYFPRYAYAPPADFHKDATKRVLANPEHYEVRLWSRELAKSTRTMMEVLYLTLVGHKVWTGGTAFTRHRKRHVLLISNSLDNAIRLLTPYRSALEINKRIIQDYGRQESIGSWQMNEFTTQHGVAFRAIGVGQSPRGARNEEVRPDIILFDDVDTDADCLNRELVAQRWRWIEEAAIGTRSVSEPTTIIFCGNRIAIDCSIQRAAIMADHTEEVNIRNKQGHSTWPQKNKETDIDRVLGQKSYAAQQKEYFNNPLTEGSVFKQLAYKPARPLSEYTMLVCYTDPSYKDTNDYKATVLVGKWKDEYHVIKCFLQQATTAQMIQWHYAIMDLVQSNRCLYFMEEVFMQDVIRKEVYDEGKRQGRVIDIRGDRRKKPDKYTRIESLLEPLHRNGELWFNKDELEDPHMIRLSEQFIAFAPRSRAHDDGPDAVEGAIWKINEITQIKETAGYLVFPRQENGNRL